MITCDLCLEKMDYFNDINLNLRGVNEVCDDCAKIQHVMYREIYDESKEKISAKYVKAMKVRFPNSRISECHERFIQIDEIMLREKSNV